MGKKYECPDCGDKVVLVNSGGVHRTNICFECNREMEVIGSEDTYWTELGCEDDYKIDK